MRPLTEDEQIAGLSIIAVFIEDYAKIFSLDKQESQVLNETLLGKSIGEMRHRLNISARECAEIQDSMLKKFRCESEDQLKAKVLLDICSNFYISGRVYEAKIQKLTILKSKAEVIDFEKAKNERKLNQDGESS